MDRKLRKKGARRELRKPIHAEVLVQLLRKNARKEMMEVVYNQLAIFLVQSVHFFQGRTRNHERKEKRQTLQGLPATRTLPLLRQK